MSQGAISGKGVLSAFKYGGREWRVSQWTNDAMDAVGNAAFRRAKMACDSAAESAEIIRHFSLGYYSFNAVAVAGGLESPELFAEFLYQLLKPNHPEITPELAREMTDDDLERTIYRAVLTANPRYGRAMEILRRQKAEASHAHKKTSKESRRPARSGTSKRGGKASAIRGRGKGS